MTTPHIAGTAPIGVDVTQEIEHVRITYVHRIETVKYACKDHPEEGVQKAKQG